MGRIEVITISVSLVFNERVQVEWNYIVCKAQRVIQEVVIVPLREYVLMLQLELVESNMSQGGKV